MGENGQVIEKVGDRVTVRLKRNEACAKCGACTMGKTENEMMISAKNLCGAKVSDWVEIELKSEHFFKAVGIMYGLPLAAFLAGIFLGNILFKSELASFFLGLALVALVYLAVRKNEYRLNKEKYLPAAVKISESE